MILHRLIWVRLRGRSRRVERLKGHRREMISMTSMEGKAGLEEGAPTFSNPKRRWAILSKTNITRSKSNITKSSKPSKTTNRSWKMAKHFQQTSRTINFWEKRRCKVSRDISCRRTRRKWISSPTTMQFNLQWVTWITVLVIHRGWWEDRNNSSLGSARKSIKETTTITLAILITQGCIRIHSGYSVTHLLWCRIRTWRPIT